MHGPSHVTLYWPDVLACENYLFSPVPASVPADGERRMCLIGVTLRRAASFRHGMRLCRTMMARTVQMLTMTGFRTGEGERGAISPLS